MKTDNGSQNRGEVRPWSHGPSRRPRRNALPRPVLLLTFFLALTTGFALLGAAAAFTDHPAPSQSHVDTPSTAATTALVQRFYAAVNDVLGTGDTAALADIVAPDLVQHPGRAGDPGAAGLARTLLAERTTWPGIRLVVDDIRATGPDAVTAWVHPEAPQAPAVLGFAVAATPAGWGPIEVLRVAGGRIAERWASASDPVLLEPLGQLQPFDTAAQTTVKIELHTLQAGASDDLFGGTDAGPRLLYVEDGTVSVALDQSPGATPVNLDARDVLEIAANEGATVTNTGPEPALILIAMAMLPQPEWATTSRPPATASSVGVAVATLTHLPVPKTGRPTIERVLLEPGVSLTRSANLGQTMILVERGTSWLTPADGRAVQVRTHDGNLHLRALEDALVPGDLVQIGAGLTGIWQAGADEPVALLVLSTGPANADPA